MSTPQVAVANNPPSGMPGDMKLVGMFSIIYGAVACLSIIGAIVGIPCIIAGLRLRDSGEAYDQVATGDPSAMQRAWTGQASYFRIVKILMIVALVLVACEIVFMFFLGGFAALTNMRRLS